MKKIIIPIILIVIALGGFITFRAISVSQIESKSQNQKEIAQVLPISDLRHATLAIDGMWCSSCAVGAEYALKEKQGVINAVVGFRENLEGVGEVIYNPEQIGLDEITKAVEPYKASITKDEQTTSTDLEDLSK